MNYQHIYQINWSHGAKVQISLVVTYDPLTELKQDHEIHSGVCFIKQYRQDCTG
jgi:hypothetical protein